MPPVGHSGAVPLDPQSRRELGRVRRAVALVLSLVSNPVGTAVGWYTEPVAGRPRRRVHIDADGHVTRVEELPPADPR